MVHFRVNIGAFGISQQMTFTDDDLKRLKDCAYPTPNDNWIGLFNNVSKSYEKFNLNALLARLEAAEKVCEMSEGEEDYLDAYKAWMKAAGK